MRNPRPTLTPVGPFSQYAARKPQPLSPVHVIKAFMKTKTRLGQAWRLPDTGEIIYTQSPNGHVTDESETYKLI